MHHLFLIVTQYNTIRTAFILSTPPNSSGSRWRTQIELTPDTTATLVTSDNGTHRHSFQYVPSRRADNIRLRFRHQRYDAFSYVPRGAPTLVVHSTWRPIQNALHHFPRIKVLHSRLPPASPYPKVGCSCSTEDVKGKPARYSQAGSSSLHIKL